jgi:hypothetical protein
MANIDRMRSSLKASVLVVHHNGHNDKTRSRGSSSIKASMDHEYCLTKEPDDRRLLTCSKMKDGREPEPVYFTLESVELDLLDAKGRREESAVLLTTGGGASIERSKPLTGAQRNGMESFYRAVIACGVDTSETTVGASLDDWRSEFYRTCNSDGQDAKKKAFQRVRTELQKNGLLKVDNDIYSIDMQDIGLAAARLVANSRKGATGHNGT